MIKVSNLVSAMQQAAQEASGAVAAEQLRLLKRFFTGVSDGGPGDGDQLTPVMVRMGFPRETADGPEQHDVYVPLISLVPLSALQLSEMEIELRLDAVEHDDEMLVGFAGRTGTGDASAQAAAAAPAAVPAENMTVRMKFGTAGQPEGMVLIVDGYSRALRAQIPN